MTYKEEVLQRHLSAVAAFRRTKKILSGASQNAAKTVHPSAVEIIAEENCEKCWNTEIPIPTNADRIRAMSNDQLRDFLAKVENGSCEPVWSKEFRKKFCDSCPTVTGKIEGYNKEMEFHECEFTDGKCPHGNELDWWLRQPAKEET